MTAYGLNKNDQIEELVKKAKSLKSLALNKTSRPPLDMVPYQRLAWVLDSNSTSKLSLVLPGLIQDAAHVWHRRLWRSSVFQQSLYQLEPSMREVSINISDGPQNLYQSVETTVCLNLLSFVEKMSAEAYENAVKQLKSLRRFLATNVNLKDRKAIEIIMLISSAYQILEASQPVLHPIFYKDLHDVFGRLNRFIDQLAQTDLYSRASAIDYDDALATFNAIISTLQSGSLNKYYVDMILSLTDAVRHYRSKDVGSFFASIGKARTLLGLAFVTAYVPDYPVDPTAEPRLRVDLLRHRKDASLNNIDVRTHIEKIATGNDVNVTIQEQQGLVDRIETELSASSTTFSLRPQKSQLDDIFVDLASLQKHLLASNTESLIEALTENTNDNKAMAVQRERLLQGNVIQFIDRIHAKYPMYRDILQPLLVAVDDVKYGLRLMVSTHQNDRADAYLSEVVSLFIRNPSLSAQPLDLDWHMLTESIHLAKLKAIVFERAPTSRKWAFYLSILVTVLQRLVMAVDLHGYLSEQDLAAINSIFAEIVQVWKAAQEYKREKEAEKEQMYKTRTKKYEPVTEEEQEEEDKKKLFADFNESFADLEESDDAPPSGATAPKVEEESVLDDSDVQRIGELHKYIFDTFRVDTCQKRDTSKNHDRELLRSYAIAAQLASMSTSAFGDSIDIRCNAGHLQATALSLQRLEATNSFSKTSDALYDFYTSENVAEAKKVHPVVQRFKARVEQIQQEWPDHAVLQQLVVICDRLLSFSIVSPVAKFLTGIELLLQKSEDWEAYAAKHVSLSAQREELIQLIVQWRQLELNCWPTLLAAQEQYSQNAAYTWWFHLFDTVNNTAFNDSTKQSELIGALDHFFQTCSLIEFEPRLKMLNSFACQARVQAELSNAVDQWSALTLLKNVCAYYSQFLGHVQLMLSQLRKPIEKDLKESVKIATWKDVNIHALRQSAHKTHKQLHKCIRKYREALGTSMLTAIANYNQEHAMFQYGDEKRYNDQNKNFIDQLSQPNMWMRETTVPAAALMVPIPSEDVKRHLQDLPGTLNKMRRYCRDDVLKAAVDIPLEDFMTQVIEQIKSYQKETPAMMTDENKSLVKNQKLLKKKALVDFLKELRRLGLKSRPGTLAAQNADTTYLFSQHVAALDTVLQDRHLQKARLNSFSSGSEDMIQLWQKANDYYYRSIARVSHLRKLCTTEVSKDLSRLEVERSMSATEHMFSLVHKERTLATRFEGQMQVLQSAATQLAALYDTATMNVSRVDRVLDQQLVAHKKWVDDLVDMIGSAAATVAIQGEYNGQQTVVSIRQLHAQLVKVQHTVDRCFVQRYLSAVHLSSPALLTADIDEMITTHESTVKATIRPAFENIMEQAPQTTHVVQAILSRIDRPGSVQSVQGEIASMTTVVTLRDQLYSMIDAILVSVQDLKKAKAESQTAALKAKETEDDDELSNMGENYIRDQHSEQFTLTQALHMDTVAKRCVSALASAHELLCTDHAQDTLCLLQQSYPFVQQYMLIIQHTLSQFLTHHKAMSKMTYALINSFTIIISKGFCMPANADEEGEEGEADGTTMGTGIGEGEGNKDVSEEIEDEEQVLGTQNEEQRKQEKSETKEEKNGMEMENDFEGELEDVEDDQDDQKQDEDDDDEEDEEEMDDEIGDVDDMDAVDDKMWGDDEAHDERKDTDKTVDQQGQQQQQESDIVAKDEEEGEDQEPQSNGEKPERQEESSTTDQKQDDQGDENDEQGDGSGDEHEEEAGEDDDGTEENRAGEQMNVEVPEAETLELPEDLDMDANDEEQEGGQDEEFFDPMDMDEETKDKAEEEMGEDDGEEFHDPLDHVGEGEQEQNQEDDELADATAQMPDQEQEGDENKEEDQEEQQEDMAGDNEQTKGGQLDEDEQEEDEKGKSHNREHPNDETDAADNQFGVQGQAGKMSSTSKGKQQGEDESAEDDARNEEEPAETKDQQGMAERGTNQANDEPDKVDEDEETSAEAKTNPQRSLGDALESWRRRLADVADADEDDEDEDGQQDKKDVQDSREAQVNDDHAFEYVKNDDDAHDMQTMGNAAVDQLQDINMGAMDETTQDEEAQAGEMDLDDEEKQQDQVDTMPLPQESIGEVQGDQRGAILSKRLPESDLPAEGEVLTMDESLVAHEPLDPEAIERMRQELETTVSEWREEGRDIHQARDLWQRYENLTHDLAMGLCEQLRLILEPTLATKLRGDYRTGKRLNMKKIIPYIASQFKKDKIWLRRTKPSKRQYQVMISVDDSKSMSESHSVQLAYETLSLISKALSQLEVGDISITSFGERIRLLHPFDQPFTAEAGASVLQQFTFAQQKTHVKQLIESSLSLFENAQNSSSGELWQLQLIISDGICDDHETLKQLVRQAMDQHVMLIFIVVDNKPENDSILKMTNVKYTTVNGKLTLQMRPYLETFPFQYFMVLRDINALPEALSDALRQYFSFVSA
ncbi:hypothetical protein BDB00DRAFT_755080 [Zychaea mexicana]|uniref:uncharacterized protein n=1 Tax=Zychaea mexicana TaxID=64656 RepID=UPI0022FE569D|nr:uncharacterized protein BDB00DRAFT_755080 [Zychaea mexicana]KAI9498449.1 hypothetical protein BDB00DRAFT_755080 [Zychaea mexicana]